ncbi:cell division protein ZapE [Pseudomonas sp. GD03860]|uniref:cell division protein ZapE n=1 Tax=Pseudomonas TaxID=286 RepID=UPI002363E9BF|nr:MULTISPECIES: cell division protein ZapE [Pseudomonas]MDD2061156.1 cell division protein ZapE [Pseudomonas putida]MDH0639018.1 cell division protein ZapE [Pseudomonas sp. GD03860]
MPGSPLRLYQQAIDCDGFVSDPAQAQAASALDACFNALQRGETPPGVYLWGPVGRGKTWLMDQFYRCLQVPARRQHFHHFMRWVHQRLFQLNGTADPLHALALSLAEEIRVLCFDELFVNDIGDAIILGRLFQVLFEAGVVVVATSNQPPDQLYSDGFNRERFLPAIVAIEQHMQVQAVAGGQDHRLHPGAAQQRYWVSEAGQPQVLGGVFAQLGGEQPVTEQPLQVGARQIQVVQRCDTVIWCRYADLCEQPLAAMDFMALCDRFTAILLGDVPALGARQRPAKIARGTEDGAQRVVAGDRELPQLSIHDDSVRRFIALVDECYDRRVALYLQAEVPLEALYTQGYLEFPFRRTLSRLREMQLQRFC